MKKTLFLLLSFLFLGFVTSCNIKEKKLIGTWSGKIDRKPVTITFKDDHRFVMQYDNSTIGGDNFIVDGVARECIYDVDIDNNHLDFLRNDKGDNELKSAYYISKNLFRFRTDNQIELISNFSNDRPLSFGYDYNKDRIILTRVN